MLTLLTRLHNAYRGGALVGMEYGFMGPNYSISTACATANYCFVAAANHIRNGEADMILAGGSEAPIIPVGLGGFVACRCRWSVLVPRFYWHSVTRRPLKFSLAIDTSLARCISERHCGQRQTVRVDSHLVAHLRRFR